LRLGDDIPVQRLALTLDNQEVPMPDTSDAFAKLVQESQQPLLGYIFAFVHNMHDAEDVYQRTLVVLWRKFDSFDPARDFEKWARGVARFEVANFLKKRRTDRLCFSDTLVAEMHDTIAQQGSAYDRGLLAYLQHCMQKLSKPKLRVLQAFYQGTSAKEIADQENRSVQGVYNSLSRIRRSLMNCVEQAMAREGKS
jgi:RNA polymerase sigma-70 factor (ECF subfamily)